MGLSSVLIVSTIKTDYHQSPIGQKYIKGWLKHDCLQGIIH
nr:MAG TPA: protein of unknown function (DUF2059) [Caudoviricetes sp.]